MKYETILTLVSDTMNVSIKDIKGKSRKREFCEARKMYVALCVYASRDSKFKGKHFTLKDCGEAIQSSESHRTHDVVHHYRKVASNLIDTDKGFRQTYTRLCYKVISSFQKQENKRVRSMIEQHVTNENGLYIMEESDMENLIESILNQ